MDWSIHYDDSTYTLSIPGFFNDPLVNLPHDVKKIIFKDSNGGIILSQFNQPISKGMLPESLTYLTFGWCFNQPINEGTLPNSITHLTLGGGFNKSLDILPASLVYLTLDYYYNSLQISNLPEHVSNVKINFGLSRRLCDSISPHIKHLTLNFCRFANDYDEPISNLPYGLEELIIEGKHKKDLVKKVPFGCKVIFK